MEGRVRLTFGFEEEGRQKDAKIIDLEKRL